MKAIDGKLAAVLVAMAVGIAGSFAPSTARASELQGQLDLKFVDGNTSTFTVASDSLMQDFLRGFMYAYNDHIRFSFLGRGGLEDAAKFMQSDASRSFGTGMAAGEGFMRDVSVWGSGSRTSSENDFAATAFRSRTRSASFGGDIRIDETATLGAFVSFSNSDTESSFNNGGSDTDTVSFGPYVSATVNENVYVDASFGFLVMKTDNFRTPVGAAARITGGQDGTGSFGAANLNYTRWLDAVNLNGRVGVSASNIQNGDYIDSTGVLIPGSSSASAQLQLEAQASYFFDNFAPFVRVGYNVEASSDVNTAPGTVQPANDKDEFVVGGGVNLFGLGPITGGVNYSRTVGRDEFRSWTVTGQISISLGGT